MVTMYAKYNGDLSCEIVHEPSGEKLFTDAPIDIGGNAAYFSPTDLVGAALLTCILTTVASIAVKYELDVTGMKGSVEKIMTDTQPRGIGKLIVQLHIPLPDDHPHREKLERAVYYCPVHNGLHPDIVKEITVAWQQSA